MSINDKTRWERKYAERSARSPGPPPDWLVENLGNLPRGGDALDLAAGDGAASLLLASRGWRVDAIDIAENGLAIGRRVAGPLPIRWRALDLDEYEPPPSSFDLVVCFRFLDRERLPAIVRRALRPGGLFLGETFNQRYPGSAGAHPISEKYLLFENEWRRLLGDFEFLAHDESGVTSRLLARKRSDDTEAPSS